MEVDNPIAHMAKARGLQLKSNKQFDVKQADLLSNPHYAKLITESHYVFSRLHKAAANVEQQENFLESLDQASREYRAVLRSAIVAVHKSRSANDRKLLLRLRGREMLWGLVEIVAFCDPDEELAVHLAKWARMMLVSEATDVRAELFEVNSGQRSAEKNDLYWNGVILEVLSCNFGTATTMLHTHTDAQSDRAVGKMVILLERLHRLFADGYSADQFTKLQQTIKKLLKENYFSKNSSIAFIARLLAGDVEAYQEVCSDLIDYWCEVVPLFTITVMPYATLGNLEECAKKCFSFNKGNDSRQLDLTIMSAMCGDLLEALLGAASCFGDWWFSAHLSDLIYRIKPDIFYEDATNLRDIFVLEYAKILMFDSELWRAGVDYLVYIDNGFDLLEENIISQKIDTKQKGLELLDVCTKWKLHKAQLSVTRKLAERSIAEFEYSDALTWALKSGDSSLIAKAVNNILSKIAAQDILTIGSSMEFERELTFTCPELAFFSTYCEFLQCANEQKIGDALEKLTLLLQGRLVPTFMYSHLLECLLSFLEEPDVQVKIGNLVQGLIQCLQKLDLEIIRSPHRIEQTSRVKEQIALLNHSLAAHLLQRDLLECRD